MAKCLCRVLSPTRVLYAKKAFRKDLYYRIKGGWLHLPPLRERKEDIPLLINKFLNDYTGKDAAIGEEAKCLLMEYEYPGNIRELIHTLERAVILSETNMLQPTDFLFPESEKEVEGVVFDNYNLDDVEKTVIRKALKKHEGNVSHAAKELGLTRTSLYRRMEKYGL